MIVLKFQHRCHSLSYVSYHNTNEENNGYVVFTIRIRWEIGWWWRRNSARPHSFLQHASGQIDKDDVCGFSSTSDIFFMPRMPPPPTPTPLLDPSSWLTSNLSQLLTVILPFTNIQVQYDCVPFCLSPLFLTSYINQPVRINFKWSVKNKNKRYRM